MNIQRIPTKIMALLLLLTLVIVGLEGCDGIKSIALTPKMSETAVRESTTDWHTYQNEKYGYSFMYSTDCYFGQMPSDCKEKPPEERRAECLCFLDSTNPDRVFLQAFLGDDNERSLAAFTISHYESPVFNPPKGTDLASWINQNFSEMFGDIPEESNMDLNGIQAVSVIHPRSPQSPGYEDVYFLHQDLLFEIKLLAVDIVNNEELYNQMLATFRLKK